MSGAPSSRLVNCPFPSPAQPFEASRLQINANASDGASLTPATTNMGLNSNSANNIPPIDEEEIYNYYSNNLLPALISSLPILVSRFYHDATSTIWQYLTRFISFLFPIWFRQWTVDTTESITHAASEGSEFLSQYWPSSLKSIANVGSNSTFVDYMMDKFDLSGANAEEMKHEIEALLHQYYQAVASSIHNQQHSIPSSWFAWFQSKVTKIITADRTLGAYLWHTCHGLILVLILTSIVPGRLHGWTGRALRFPILGMVYMLIAVELLMYTIIRLAIRFAEWVFANPKHRAWRLAMSQSKSYEEWYDTAKRLDNSQGRGEWRKVVNDDTAYRYSWPFILELLSDLKSSRETGDIIMALAVLQQCTRKNVGGIMSEDMFSFTNCGEPKQVVSEFVEEVAKTLQWVTEEVRRKSQQSSEGSVDAIPVALEKIDETNGKSFDQELKSKMQQEQTKINRSLISWATLGILKVGDEKTEKPKANATTQPTAVVPTTPTTVNVPRNDDEHAKNLILREKIKTFLKRARAAYGRTALCLSGGAMMGNYHFGAVLALLETGLLPHIISGTSAGSVIGAMICTRTDEELLQELKPEILAPKMSIFESSWGQRWKRWLKYGTMFDQDDWMNRVKYFTSGESGCIICIYIELHYCKFV